MAEVKVINRELSWIEFNARVLHEACRKEVPLLERLKFVAIVESNFDEFFQVRVSSIKSQFKSNPHSIDSSGLTPLTLLKKISLRCHQITKLQYDTLSNEILPALSKEGISYVSAEKYSQAQKSFTENLFRKEIFPLLTPLRTDLEEFPHIGNLKLNVAFLLEKIPGVHTQENALTAKSDAPLLALVQLPTGISRVVWLPGETTTKQFAVLDDIIALYGTELFPGYSIKETMLFKVTRGADFAVDENTGSDFIQAMEEVLQKRKSSSPVRLIYNNKSKTILTIIQQKLFVKNDDIYEVNGLIDPTTLLDLTSTE